MMSKSHERPSATENSTERKLPATQSGIGTCSLELAGTHVPLLWSIHRGAVASEGFNEGVMMDDALD
tara:strand:+ start:1619 stop:1819 length:201 start_codon:yes stop_codon:yes gene_type:complete